MWLFFNYPSSLKHPEDHYSLICSINISWRRSNSWKRLCWMNSRLQFTYQCGTCCIFYCAKAQSLSIPVNSFKWGGLVDHLRGHQDHVVIFFVTFNLTQMKFVGSGSLLCRVIDPRPVYYLEHWSLLLQHGYKEQVILHVPLTQRCHLCQESESVTHWE